MVTDFYIIFSNSDQEFVFYDMQGHFVKKFCHAGQGPGEYPYIGSVVYDSFVNQLIVCHDNKILYYTMDGQFIKSNSIDTQYFLWDVKTITRSIYCAIITSLSPRHIYSCLKRLVR